MILHLLIVEQIESDGTLRSFIMEGGRNLVVAFPEEFSDDRAGPLHFLSVEHERQFRERAHCSAKRLHPDRFRRSGEHVSVTLPWRGIPTEQGAKTLYVLSLPQGAVPSEVTVTDLHSGRNYDFDVRRDDEHMRWAVYLECRSRHGRFDFDLTCTLRLDSAEFSESTFEPPEVLSRDHSPVPWEWHMAPGEPDRVRAFYQLNAEQITMGDSYHGENVGAMGSGASAGDVSFDQRTIGGDMATLAKQLGVLRRTIKERSDANPEEASKAIAALGAAEEAAHDGDEERLSKLLKAAGEWTFDVATKIGTRVAAAALRASLGI